MTEYGNTWVSDYAWGWAPFHYGRWHLDDYYGWMWVPGTEWSPAWVAWRSGGGYYGWAPLSPGLNVNVSINIGRRIPRPYWTFVPQRYITSPRVYDYCVPRPRVVNVINHTTIINNTYVYNNQHRYYSGPQGRDIERVTHRPVPVRRVQNARQPGATSVRNGSVAMYRPTVRSRQDDAQVTSGASRIERNAIRSSTPTRSSDNSGKRATATSPAVRSLPRSETRSAETRSTETRSSMTQSMHDNRSKPSVTPRRMPSQPSSSGARESRSVSSPAQSRNRYGERPSSNRSQRRSVPSSTAPRTRSSASGSLSSSRSVSPSRSGSRSSSPSMSSSRTGTSTRSASSGGSSRSSASSSGSRRSSTPSGRSQSGGASRGASRSRPQ